MRKDKDIIAEDFYKKLHLMYEAVGTPYGFIQYKGTDLCMDINCSCGHLGHIDGDFISAVKCANCGKVFILNIFIKLIPLEGELLESFEKYMPFIKQGNL